MEHYHSYYIHGNLGKNTFNQPNPKTTTNTSRYGLNTNSFVISNSGQLSPALMDQCDTHLSSLTLNHHHTHHNHHHHSPRTTKSSNGNNHPTKSSSSNHHVLHNHLHHQHAHTTVQLPPIDMSIEEQRALGYMPLRDDFEREFKNHAEVLLSTLSVANNQAAFISRPISDVSSEPNEDFLDYEMKLTLIKMYREVLIERQKMKKIAREYGLINNASALINNYNSSLNAAAASVGVGGNAAVCFTPSVRECTDGRRRKRGQNGNASRKDPR